MKALIIANGTLPTRQHIRGLISSVDMIICADGGANAARKMHVTPDVILGDMDSISPTTRKFFRSVPFLTIDDQNSTDMEKALQFCVQRGITTVDVLGAIGERVDHTTANLGCFRRFGEKIDLKIIDSVGEVSLIRKETRLKTAVGEKISLIPLERCEGVTTKNLKYALHDDRLELGVREGISNEATARQATIKIKRGTLLLYRFHKRS